jgi:hypothetical protein
MVAIAVTTVLVTAWEILDAFRRARRSRRPQPALGLGQTQS